MGAWRLLVVVVSLAGCLPPGVQPDQPVQPMYAPQPQPQPQPVIAGTVPQGQPPQVAAVDPNAPQAQPAPQAAPVQPGAPQPAPQPYYPPQGQPYYPPQGQPQPYYPPQGQPQGQPYYPPQGQPYYPPQGQPYYPPQGQPYTYAQPYAQPVPSGRDHLHDGEVIGNFAVVGVLASTDILVRQNVTNGDAITFVTLAGLAGGGGLGYLMTQKFPIDASAAHATTIGTMVGIANGALLIQPTGANQGDTVIGLLLAGSAVGAAGGFLYGQEAKLTPGQSMFVGNMALLGGATGALTAIAGNRDGNYGGFENGSIAVGLDAGVLIGALVAPHLDWSPRREKYVFASSFVGALVGALIGGLATKPSNGSTTDANATVVTSTMTGGLWGGFALGILLTKDSAPDPSFLKPANATPSTQPTAAPPASAMPFVGDRGQFGIAMGGSF